jgi:hypothetical protein
MPPSKSSVEVASTPNHSGKLSINEEEKAISSDKHSIQNGDEDEDDSQYLSGLKLGLIMLGLCLSCFLVGLVCLPLSE